MSARDGSTFEQQVLFLKRHFDIASPDDFENPRRRFDRLRIFLTFDDGLRNHVEVVAPILRRHNIPAIFFVPSRHSAPGRYLWFSYLQALERHFEGSGFAFRGERIGMAIAQRHQSITRLSEMLLALTPHPASMYEAIEQELPPLEEFVGDKDLIDRYAGMMPEHVGDLASDRLFEIGAHTVDHPLLTRCSSDEAIRQLAENKRWLEQITNRRCDAIAYPSGNYDGSGIGCLPAAGIQPWLCHDADPRSGPPARDLTDGDLFRVAGHTGIQSSVGIRDARHWGKDWLAKRLGHGVFVEGACRGKTIETVPNSCRPSRAL